MTTKIPKNAKRVFKGIIWDVYQWEQNLQKDKVAIFESLKRNPNCRIIVVKNKKIMVAKEKQIGKGINYTLPGGRIEKGEKPLEAAKRELLEEAGFIAKSWKLYKIYNEMPKIDFPEHLYIAKHISKVQSKNLDSGEVYFKYKFMNFEEFLLMAKKNIIIPLWFKLEMYEALCDKNKKRELRKIIFS